MQYNTLLTRIAADIYSNGAELITGDLLQNVLNDMVGALASAGACYKGTITPASAAPLDLDQPTVYLALTAGTYTNFVDSNNDPIVTTGPALITYDGGPSLVFTKTDLPSGSPDAVLYTPQALTDTQKAQARTNIGAASASDVTSIESYIPAQASAQNQLADKNFVNSSIQTNTATFRGTYYDLKAFVGYSRLEYGIPDNNDYAVVRNVETSAWDADNVYQADEVCLYDDGVSSTKIFLCIKDMVSTPRSITPDQDTEYWKEWMNIEELLVYHGPFVGTWRFKYVPNGAFDITNWQPEYQVNEKPLTAAQLAALNSGITDTKVAKLDALPATIPTEVFWATRGTTTATEIDAAVAAGKIVMCADDGKEYRLSNTKSGLPIIFSCDLGATLWRLTLDRTTGNWSNAVAFYYEQTANKKSSWSNTPANANYPSEKLVYDSLGKKGVISQTQTWSGTGSNPRTYVMSDQVYGLIPQSFIDLATSAGATFNSGTGYFGLNGLTDISYEEMRVIYDCTIGLIPNILRDKALAGNTTPTIRTTLPMRGVTSFASSIQYFAYGNNYLEQIVFNPVLYNSAQNNGTGAFQNCYCLKSIFGMLRLYSTTNDADIFKNCYSLENVNIDFLRGSIALSQSSALSLASVVYMVENAVNTSAITITLHATAYARCQADTTEYTYGGQTYTGILALATAHNITIASA